MSEKMVIVDSIFRHEEWAYDHILGRIFDRKSDINAYNSDLRLKILKLKLLILHFAGLTHMSHT